MKRLSLPSVLFGIVLALALRPAYVWAVNFTIVLSQDEVDIATWKWNQVDPTHTSFATAQLFGAAEVRKLIVGWKDDRRANRRNVLGPPAGYFCTVTWPGLTQTQKDNNVCIAALGEIAGCTPCSVTGD